ncbi:NAD-dependent epimerase/dehydratase [Amycolatopsis anabasis]|uniref:NAD-dependent epimerase/dehydratase n=1 Tax=Amycolatopsis anabasis TaxID=1840409 RepID=UPI00131E2C61|nr:NAD-dependent epimerase/dehydratase [Amycolatopsis anabasis]
MTDKPLVVVLGASGFLGTAVTAELADRPIRLRLVARRPATVPVGAKAETEVRTADLTAPGALADAVAGADAVIHLVAHITGASTWRVEEGDTTANRVNLGLVHDLIDALRAQRRDGPPPVVVFSGSLSQVGKPTGPRITGSEFDEPASEYDRLKLAAEQALRDATTDGVVRACTLRLATLYGQGNGPLDLERGVVSAMMRRAFAGEPLTMWHDGTVARDLVCVDDVARAFAAALDHADALAGRHWLIGTGESTAIGDLFAAIADAVAAVTGRPPVPVESVESEHAGASDLLDFVVGSTAFGETTGWSPQVSLRAALHRAAVARHAANEN